MISQEKRSEEIFGLLEDYRLSSLWYSFDADSRAGPKQDAVLELDLIGSKESRLSFGEQILLRVAFDLWNGRGCANLWNVMVYLNPETVHRILRIVKMCTPV